MDDDGDKTTVIVIMGAIILFALVMFLTLIL